jgi:pimeloyl-ACP methyl ester carboxylesterase
MGYLDVEGGKLYYEVAGEGHPLLLIHAGIAHSGMWDPQWEEFARRYRVIRYDTRGYGKTSTDADDTSFSNRQDIFDLLQHLGVDRTYVIGVSRGGQIALDFTLEHPEKVDALILVAAGLSGYEPSFSEEQLALFDRFEKLWEAKDWETLSDLETAYWVDGADQPEGRADSALRRRVRDMIFFNYTNQPHEGKPCVLEPAAHGRLSEVTVPTLIISGDLDERAVMEIAEVQVQGIAGAKKVVMSGTAHVPNMEKPEEFNRIVLDFLSSLEPQQA